MELAAEMAETIVHKVDSSMLLLQDLALGKHFPQQLAGLKDIIMSLRAKLVDSQVSSTNPNQDWLNKVRASLYDIEHLVDSIYTDTATARQMKHQQDSTSFLCFKLQCLLVFYFNYGWKARNINNMRKKFMKQVADNASSYMEPRSDQEETRSSLSAAPPVGREPEKNAINRLLVGDLFSAVLIFGKAGLGKTTVAQLVFNNPRLPSFDLKFWVWVGNVLDQSSVISKISEEITKQIPAGPSNTTLQNAIQGKKVLLVLDDVRSLDEDTLASIRDYYSVLGSSSATKVVITTRSEQVATANYGQIPTTRYDLGAISDDDAWTLFQEVAFNNHQNPELLDLGWEMMTRTNNVPRIIKDLAPLVKGEDQRKWKALMNADFSCLMQGYSPFTSSSYLAFSLLPTPLKRCFAYSAFLFQQNDNIEMQKLIHLWIAQGYIKEPALDDENQTLEEVSEGYYRDLQDWSFFKDHGLDFDLAKSFAASEMLAINFNCAQDGSVLGIEPYDCNGIYHLFISSTSSVSTASSVASNPTSSSLLKDFIASLSPQLRSFLKAQGSTVSLTESICHQLFSSLGCLHALDLNSSNIIVVPASISLLKHLRFLNLSLNDFTILPDSITSLAKLQVLDLSSCKKLVKLPTHFSRLSSLRHLYLDGCERLIGMPVGLRKMTALQTLNVFVLGNTQKSCKLDELSSLNLKSEFTYRFASQL